MLRILIAIFSFSFASSAKAPPLMTIECLVLDGIISHRSRTWDKPLTFKTVDIRKQNRFRKSLKEIVNLNAKASQDQCHHSCGVFVQAHLLDLIAPTDFGGSISGGYIAAKVFELKFRNSLTRRDEEVSAGTYSTDVSRVLHEEGVMTKSQYPSRSDINIPSLVSVLNKVAEDYREEIKRNANNSEKVQQLSDEAQYLVSELVQFYFGKYPTRVYRKGKETSSQEQYRLLNKALSKVSVEEHQIDDYSEFAKVAGFMLENKLPIKISYHVEGTHPGDGVFSSGITASRYGPRHGVIIAGIYRDTDGTIYYRVLNTHGNAKELFFSEKYLRANFEVAEVLLPFELESKYLSALSKRF